jgi:hypothetical protein
MFISLKFDITIIWGKFFDISKKGAPIPGYSGTKEWIPQGLALVPSKNWIIISHIGAIRTAIKPAASRLQAAKPTNVSPCKPEDPVSG